MDLREIDILGDAMGEHWYYRSKALAIRRLLGPDPASAILDVGAGSGFFSRFLLDHDDAVRACCVDNSYTHDTDEITEQGKQLLKRRRVDSSDADLVLMMDVLEHVEDDVGMLAQYAAMSPPASRFIITVPAFDWLWSSHDEFLGHQRRYTVRQVEALVRSAGLRINACHYFFGLVLPLALPGRLSERLSRPDRPLRSALRKHHPAVNTLLGVACKIELPWMQLNRVAGLSVFCLAQKAP